jgi:phage shock protein PspC (stress-responsive transcriptional regulator)
MEHAGVEGERLYRPQTDKRIAGVADGIAEHFGIDRLLVRLAFVVAAFMGFGVLLYLVLWILLPKGPEPGQGPPGRARASRALRIAEERYARGEIGREEFLERRAVLLGASPGEAFFGPTGPSHPPAGERPEPGASTASSPPGDATRPLPSGS